MGFGNIAESAIAFICLNNLKFLSVYSGLLRFNTYSGHRVVKYMAAQAEMNKLFV